MTTLAATGILDGPWDVLLKDGLLYVTDAALRVAFGCVTPGGVKMSSIG